MNKLSISVLSLLLLLASGPTKAEVCEIDVIDAVATKPGSNRAFLLLHQLRPWSKESVDLLTKKLSFYLAAIKSKALV